jgi:hypothetical protein
MRVLSNGYFFFFLVVFFAFFAFLAMLLSVVPEVGSMQVEIDMHRLRIHHNCKIDTARFEEGKRPSRRAARDEPRRTKAMKKHNDSSDARVGVFVRTQTSPEIITKPNSLVTGFVNSAESKNYLATIGATPFPSTPEELGAFQEIDTGRWAEIVETAKIEKK